MKLQSITYFLSFFQKDLGGYETTVMLWVIYIFFFSIFFSFNFPITLHACLLREHFPEKL